MSDSVKHYARAKNSDCFNEIQRLREHYGNSRCAAMLGITEIALGWRKQPIPVVRCAFLLHRITFPTGEPLTVLEILTMGKFDPTPEERRRWKSKTSGANLDYEI